MSAILAALPEPQEIIGMYPEISATRHVHKQTLELRRGDSDDIPIQLQTSDDPPDPLNWSGGLLRWGLTQQSPNVGPVPGESLIAVSKSSTDPMQIEAVGSSQAILHLTPDDTKDLPLAVLLWSLELTMRKETLVSGSAGATLLLYAGMSLAVLTAPPADLDKLRSGDLLEAQGKTARILDASGGMLTLSWSDWIAGNTSDFTIYRGSTKVVASGVLNVLSNPIR